MNEREVKEHLSFIHPFYGGKLQNIFFSQDLGYMFEHLVNERYLLYKRVDGAGNKVTWQQVHRFTNYPTDITRMARIPFIFSKDFSMYLDVDRKNKKFMIRDSFTQEIRYNIPEWLMDLSNENETYLSISFKFLWVDNDTIKIINSEGIERLIDLKNNFKELEFNKIPLFKNEWTLTIDDDCNPGHYYLEPPTPEPPGMDMQSLKFETLERLKRKY